MNLFSSKLRRTVTVFGGSVLGLGIAAALATPALACHPQIESVSSCVNADGSWVVNWAAYGSDRGIPGEITDVQATPADSTLTGFVKGASLPGATRHHAEALQGVQTVPAGADSASVTITAHFVLNGQDIIAPNTSKTIDKPTEQCKNQPSQPSTPSSQPSTPSTPSAPSTPSTPATPTPTTSVPVTEPQFVYDETCTTFTVGIEVPKTWKSSVTVTFTPSKGAPKTVTAKPGETQTVDFPASKGLTVTAAPKGYPGEGAKIAYTAPKDCTSASPTPSTSTSGVALPVTGSSSAPLAGGAVALVALGGGAFFLARRRKMKFTA